MGEVSDSEFAAAVAEHCARWYSDPQLQAEWSLDDLVELLELAGIEPPVPLVEPKPERRAPLAAAEGDDRMSRYENILRTFTARPVTVVSAARAARAIERDLGSAEIRAMRSRKVRRPCPKCGAAAGERCLRLNVPGRHYLKGGAFHRER